MNGDDIYNGVTDIRDDQIEAAGKKTQKKRFLWAIPAAAAVLVILSGAFIYGAMNGHGGGLPNVSTASCPNEGSDVETEETTAPKENPTEQPRQDEEGGLNVKSFAVELAKYPDNSSENSESWMDDWAELLKCRDTYSGKIDGYFTYVVPELLKGSGDENAVCSPLNLYITLSMAAELTGGESRQQILDLLGCPDIETVRERAEAIWKYNYKNSENQVCLMANSVWLADGIRYRQDTLHVLADKYFASSFSGDMSVPDYTQLLKDWVKENTGGLLDGMLTDSLYFTPETVMALTSTVYFKVLWNQQFNQENNTTDVFHSPSGDVDAEYMNKTYENSTYYYGDIFSAVSLSLNDSGRMWIILPDEGVATDDVLKDQRALRFMFAGSTGSADKAAKNINLSLPKFDVSSDSDLKSQLEALGVRDIFDPLSADFSPMLDGEGELSPFVSKAEHAVRVKIDEDGLEAASLIYMPITGEAPYEEREDVDFIVNRPFIFVVAGRDQYPLFAGVVNNPQQ